ncbi:purine-cytosine permease FCY21 [Diaporthe helianthi]|uniref:Purine-cytosine permease FCY21 n=1 Tax=Diaporthe helianthi TaxID=158607 RepID=A0A2P5IFG5_DIAHE|nr:purine-cytosine permease FCY21 [Diaporthe helianthi]
MSTAVSRAPGDTSDVEKNGAGEEQRQQQQQQQHGRYNQHQQKYQRHGKLVSMLKVDDGEVYESHPEKHPRWYQLILDVGVEENGIKPVPVERRTDGRFYNLFTVMFTALLCLLPLPTGMLATISFGMSLRDASLVILFFSVITVIPPAFLGIGGTQTGLRQQVQARYSFGLYLATVPLLLNAATIIGFSLVAAIVGGQALAAVNPTAVSDNVGIVVVCLVSFVASLMGYRALHLFNTWSWIPNLVAIIIAVGCGGSKLRLQSDVAPATVQQVLSYGGLIAGYFLTFGGTVSDYSIYHDPRALRKPVVFASYYLGMFTPSVPLLILGAAIGGATPNVPEWAAAYEHLGIGGVVAEMLTPAGGFGKFVLVLLALSVIGNIAISMYSVALCLQMIVPFFARIHRFVFIVATFAVMIPCSIEAARAWEESLENFLALIGYWAGCFDAVLITDLVVFRRMDYSSYEHAIWNVGRELPTGIPALLASVISFGLVVPGMAEAWYTGPIAKKTGDIGFESAFVVTALCYFPLRWLEIRWRGRL